MKTYTEAQLHEFITTAINESINGVMDWIKNDTDIIDVDSKVVIPNSEIALKAGTKEGIREKYIYPKLKNHGIVITLK